EPGQLAGQVAQLLLPAGHEGDPQAAAGQLAGDLRTDAGRRAGDDAGAVRGRGGERHGVTLRRLGACHPGRMDAPTARRLWLVGEPIHALTYFSTDATAAWEAAGVRGFWRGYFATRAAPLGPVGAGPVVATFYNFAPGMVERALPAVW